MAVQNTSAHSLSSTEQFIWFGVWWLISLFGVFGNALIIIIFFKYKQLRKIEYIYLLFGLALLDFTGRVSDAFVAIPVQLYWTINKATRIVTWQCSSILFTPGVSSHGCQILIIAIAFDRYQLFARPFVYNKKNHKKWALHVSVVAWVYGTAQLVLSWAGVDLSAHLPACTAAAYLLPGYKLYYMVCIFVISPIVIGYFAAALHLMHKHLRKQKDKALRSKNSAAFLRQVRASRVVMYTILLFLLAWVLPNFLFVLSVTFSAKGSLLMRLSSRLVGLGANLNASANVLVYYVFNRHMRKYLLKFMCRAKE